MWGPRGVYFRYTEEEGRVQDSRRTVLVATEEMWKWLLDNSQKWNNSRNVIHDRSIFVKEGRRVLQSKGRDKIAKGETNPVENPGNSDEKK